MSSADNGLPSFELKKNQDPTIGPTSQKTLASQSIKRFCFGRKTKLHIFYNLLPDLLNNPDELLNQRRL